MIPPRNTDKDPTIVHRHTGINGPKPMRQRSVEDEIIKAAKDAMFQFGVYAFCIGLVVGLVIGWLVI